MYAQRNNYHVFVLLLSFRLSICVYDLKLSRRLTLIKYFWAISRVSWLKITGVSRTISVPIIRAVV
jgi:hypothetical protein